MLLLRNQKITAIFQTFGGRGSQGIHRKNFRRDELGVEAVADRVAAGGRGDQPKRIDRLRAMDCNDTDGNCAQ